MIRATGISKRFNGTCVLDRLDVEVADSKVLVILGPSGIGKTVLLRILTGLVEPDSGTVEYDGVRLRFGAFADNQRILSRLGFVFQGGALFDSLTVRENVALPLREHHRLDSTELLRRVDEALERVGMATHARLMPSELSGGMVRLVAIARALAANPKYVFYDEPTTGLDPVMRERILELIASLRDREGKTEVAVTHDLEAAQRIADTIYMLREGRLVTLEDARKEHYEPGCS